MSAHLATPEKTTPCDCCKGNFGVDKGGKCNFCGFRNPQNKRSCVTPDTASRGRKRLKLEVMSSNTKFQNEIPEDLRFVTIKHDEDAVDVARDHLSMAFGETHTALASSDSLDTTQMLDAVDIDADISPLENALTPMNSEDMMFMMEHWVSDMKNYECNV
jgi:hypothetical protein